MITCLSAVSEDIIIEKIVQYDTSAYIAYFDEDVSKSVQLLRASIIWPKSCFLIQLVARFLMLWMKRCVILSAPKEATAIGVVYLVVLLAHGRSLSLLQIMVYGIQNGLGVMTQQFWNVRV